ncbi:MAG: adenylate/guanylate cyclase domain-containing protein [Betaproteobacteria bacterium]
MARAAQGQQAMPETNQGITVGVNPKPARIIWLPLLVFLTSVAGLGLLAAYSSLNLRPDLSAAHNSESRVLLKWVILFAIIAPTLAAVIHIWPITRWLREARSGKSSDIDATIAQRAANAPLALAAFSLVGWVLFTAVTVIRVVSEPEMPFGLAVHFVLRPLLAGLIVATATFFSAEYLCRAYVWPTLLAGTRIVGNPRLRRVRLSHRLLVLWLAISALPLSAVALMTYTRVAGVDLAADALLGRIVSVVLLIAVSAAVGGAWLAWLVSRSIAQPLESLERAMASLREGRFDTREPVNATDEIGAVTEGFNLMTERLSQSYADLATRNRELAAALDRVIFLEHVKRSLDRFVPETVRRAIEANPDAPGLAKQAKDVTVLFLDIEGYTRLSEELPRPALNALVERYFSLFLTTIRAEEGDINETAGDGLMIIFQAGAPDVHAAAAVRAALAIRKQTIAANQNADPTHPPIQVNIGISSGECDVGTTRFEGPAGERWTFTATGPVTNLAARLGDRATGGQILLSPQTARRVRDSFSVRSVGALALKNLSHPVEAWEVQGVL